MKTHILVVDDDEYWRERARKEIAELKYEIIEADGFHAARDAIEKYESQLALVVCDNNMPLGGRPAPSMGLEIRADMQLTSDAQAAIPFTLFTSEVNEEPRQWAEQIDAHIVIKQHNVSGPLLECAKRLLGK